MKNPLLAAGQLKKSHPKLLGNISERTIQHGLQKELYLPTFKSAKKPLLTKVMVIKRFAFAHKYENWTEEELTGCFLVTKAPSNVSDHGLDISDNYGILTTTPLCILEK